jgi:ATP-dependent RNA helicase DHX36
LAYSKVASSERAAANGKPRFPCWQLCGPLQVKAVLPDRGIANTLAAALTPPEPAAVEAAVSLLRARQLLDENEALTPLGRHLTNLPLDPAIGALCCLDCCVCSAA